MTIQRQYGTGLAASSRQGSSKPLGRIAALILAVATAAVAQPGCSRHASAGLLNSVTEQGQPAQTISADANT